MEEMLITIAYMAKELDRKPDTVKRQLQAKGIKPAEYAGPTGMYRRSAMEAIRNVPSRGRPKAKPPEPEKPPSKTKKPKK